MDSPVLATRSLFGALVSRLVCPFHLAARGQGALQTSNGIGLALQGKGLLLHQLTAMVIVVHQDSTDFLGHHRRQGQFPAHRRQHAMGTALHRMGEFQRWHRRDTQVSKYCIYR